jgi:hypothetical protein
MTADDLRALLLATWADPPELVGQRIFRADPTLPMLCCDLDVADAGRCARIALDVVRRRGRRSRKMYAVCLNGTHVSIHRECDVDPGALVGIVHHQTPVELLESQLRGKRAANRAVVPEFQGWTPWP